MVYPITNGALAPRSTVHRNVSGLLFAYPQKTPWRKTDQSYYQIHSITNHGLLPNERVLVYQHDGSPL